VLRFHKVHCLPSLDKIDEELAEIKVEIDKDSVKVTE
jgi:hypothetical protein